MLRHSESRSTVSVVRPPSLQRQRHRARVRGSLSNGHPWLSDVAPRTMTALARCARSVTRDPTARDDAARAQQTLHSPAQGTADERSELRQQRAREREAQRQAGLLQSQQKEQQRPEQRTEREQQWSAHARESAAMEQQREYRQPSMVQPTTARKRRIPAELVRQRLGSTTTRKRKRAVLPRAATTMRELRRLLMLLLTRLQQSERTQTSQCPSGADVCDCVASAHRSRGQVGEEAGEQIATTRRTRMRTPHAQTTSLQSDWNALQIACVAAGMAAVAAVAAVHASCCLVSLIVTATAIADATIAAGETIRVLGIENANESAIVIATRMGCCCYPSSWSSSSSLNSCCSYCSLRSWNWSWSGGCCWSANDLGGGCGGCCDRWSDGAGQQQAHDDATTRQRRQQSMTRMPCATAISRGLCCCCGCSACWRCCALVCCGCDCCCGSVWLVCRHGSCSCLGVGCGCAIDCAYERRRGGDGQQKRWTLLVDCCCCCCGLHCCAVRSWLPRPRLQRRSCVGHEASLRMRANLDSQTGEGRRERVGLLFPLRLVFFFSRFSAAWHDKNRFVRACAG